MFALYWFSSNNKGAEELLESCIQHIYRSIVIPVHCETTFAAMVLPVIKRLILYYITTIRACSGCVPGVYLNTVFTGPLSLVNSIIYKFTPWSICYAFSQIMVLHHICNIQVLICYEVVIVYQLIPAFFVSFQFLDSVAFSIFIRSESGRIDMETIKEERPAAVINYECELKLIISDGFNHHSENQIFTRTWTYKWHARGK